MAFPTTNFGKNWTIRSSEIGEFLYASMVATICQCYRTVNHTHHVSKYHHILNTPANPCRFTS